MILRLRRVPSGLARADVGFAVVAVIVASLAVRVPSTAVAQETTASASVYVRDDSDRTTVISPRIQVDGQVAEQTRVGAAYMVDVWTSASIDIRTAATPRVTEQRDELDLNIAQGLTDTMTLDASYRYSTEVDYESHGGSLGLSVDLADNAATLAVTGRVFIDRVGRAGDPDFWRDASTVVGRVSLTQVIDPELFVQLIYEFTRQEGFLSSPYRLVRYAAPSDLEEGPLPSRCQSEGEGRCGNENNPDSRLRHALGVVARQALSDNLSVGANYRFYLDDWGILSNTASVDGALKIGEGWLVGLGYRFYQQSLADHYSPFYLAATPALHVTSDKELSSFTSHRLDLSLSRTFAAEALGGSLRAILLAAPSYFSYSDFPLLDSISAIELTLAVEALL